MEEESKVQKYYSDKPIKNIDEDLLGRGEFSKQLAQALINLNSEETFTVGLYGKWGSGKTSVINMMIKEIKNATDKQQDKPIIIKFNPWNYSNDSQLLSQFFKRIADKIEINDKNENKKSICKVIKDYSSALSYTEYIPVIGKYLSILPQIAAIVSENALNSVDEKTNNISYQKEQVIKALKGLEHKIIIVIDDIDRLSNESIRLIFKLVNSVADFPNVVYMLSFDKEVVTRALSEVQKCDGEKYLEKIIQVPFTLPDIGLDKILNVFISRIDDIIPIHKIVENDYFADVVIECIKPYLNSIRDINRIINTLQLKISLIGNETDFADLVAITVLEVLLPKLYTWIRENKTLLLGNNTFEAGFNEDENIKEECIKEFKEIYPRDPQAIYNTLICLFPSFQKLFTQWYSSDNNDELRRQNRIADPDKFERYFSLSLRPDMISKSCIISKIYNLDENGFMNMLKEWNNEGKIMSFLSELKAQSIDIPVYRISVILKCLFEYASNIDSQYINGKKSLLSGREVRNCIDKLITRIQSRKERANILKEIFKNCSLECFEFFTTYLNQIELAYGRLAAKGNAHGTQIIDLEDLKELEKIFVDDIKKHAKSVNVLDMKNSKLINHIWESLDEDCYKDYINKKFENYINICKYITFSSVEWTGGTSEWEYTNEYEKFFKADEVRTAIEECINNKSLFTLDIEIQKSDAAFVLWCNRDKNSNDEIKNEDVIKLVEEWKNGKLEAFDNINEKLSDDNNIEVKS